MKEYESKSLEELRVDDYVANRKGPQAGGAAAPSGGGGLFGAPPNQTASTSGGLFGTTTATQSGGLFGAQQNKPMFGASSSSGFGTTNSFGNTTSGFGTNTSTSGGLFGNKPAGFGTAVTSSNTGFGFGAQQQNTATVAGGLFGQANQQNNSFGAKPFGAATTQSGGLFGSTAPAFGGTNTNTTAFGATNTGEFIFS